MENTSTEFKACPHCGGRLVAGASMCLHCNEEVDAQPVESDGALGRFLLVAIGLFAVLGAGALIIVQAVTGDAEQKIPKAQTFDAEDLPKIVCLDDTKADAIRAFRTRGLREVPGKPGKRCFAE